MPGTTNVLRGQWNGHSKHKYVYAYVRIGLTGSWFDELATKWQPNSDQWGTNIYAPAPKIGTSRAADFVVHTHVWCIPASCVIYKENNNHRGSRAPVRHAEGAPLLFSLYITQETGMHQTWACTTKGSTLEGPIFGAGAYMLVPH
jgi:hypothetical protein